MIIILYPNEHINIKESLVIHFSGGISMEEMIVPVAIMESKDYEDTIVDLLTNSI